MANIFNLAVKKAKRILSTGTKSPRWGGFNFIVGAYECAWRPAVVNEYINIPERIEVCDKLGHSNLGCCVTLLRGQDWN